MKSPTPKNSSIHPNKIGSEKNGDESSLQEEHLEPSWKYQLRRIIFEADTPAGKWFDILLIALILVSVTIVMLDSVHSIHDKYAEFFRYAEWFFTILFTIEYVLRLICVRKPLNYAFSFFGLVDLIAIVPSYLSLLMPGSQYLISIRTIRALRVFRVLKFVEYLSEADLLMKAIKASRRKVTVFLFSVLTMVVILGSLMYLIEGEENGFTSIPRSVYWAIVTLTTVGYGDISPKTAIGQLLAAISMVLGYGIIAVPTGIVTVEISKALRNNPSVNTRVCGNCASGGHDDDASFCKYCGFSL